jgi:hypothetical protein
MDSAYNFIKITLLGLILGILIIFLFQVNYWADEIRKTVRQSVTYRNNVDNQKPFKKRDSMPPAYKLPNTPKHNI